MRERHAKHLGPAEHFEQEGRSLLGNVCRNSSKFAHQSLPIHGAQLIQGGLAGLSLKPKRYARGVRSHGCGHRRNDDRPQMPVHLIGRDHQARPGLPDFRTVSRIECYQPDLIAQRNPVHHRHSLRSNSLVPACSRRRSSSTEAPAARNPSSQPARGRRCGEMTRHLFSTRSSTSSPKPHCSIKGFGIRMPRELPIRTRSIFIPVSGDVITLYSRGRTLARLAAKFQACGEG